MTQAEASLCSDAQKSAVFEEPFDSLISLLVAFVDYDNFKLSRFFLIFLLVAQSQHFIWNTQY